MSYPAARFVFRKPNLRLHQLIKRNASATAQVTETAKEKSSQAVSQASQGLSKVTTSASSTLSKAGDATGRAASRIGGRVGRTINMVQGNSTPLYSRMLKLLAIHRHLTMRSLRY